VFQQAAAGESLTDVGMEEKEVSSEIQQAIKQDSGAAARMEWNKATNLMEEIVQDAKGGAGVEKLSIDKSQFDSEFAKNFKLWQARLQGTDREEFDALSNLNGFDTQLQKVISQGDKAATTDLDFYEKDLAAKFGQINQDEGEKQILTRVDAIIQDV